MGRTGQAACPGRSLIDGPSPDGVRPKTVSLSCCSAEAAAGAGAGDMVVAVCSCSGACAVRDLWVCWPMLLRGLDGSTFAGASASKMGRRVPPKEPSASPPCPSPQPPDGHLAMSFAFPLSTTGALSFNDHLIAPEQDLALRLDQATTARAGLRGVLKDDKRTADGQRDPNAIVAVGTSSSSRDSEVLKTDARSLTCRPSRSTCPTSARSLARSSRTTSSSGRSRVRPLRPLRTCSRLTDRLSCRPHATLSFLLAAGADSVAPVVAGPAAVRVLPGRAYLHAVHLPRLARALGLAPRPVPELDD